MDQPKHQNHLDEIISLNADDLQIEELERRLEMALVMPLGFESAIRVCPSKICGINTICGTNCPQLTFG